MAVLLTWQIREVRDATGDYDYPYDVDDIHMQELYENQADNDLDILKVLVLRIRLGRAVNSISSGNETGTTASRNQKFEQLERLLKYWEARTGKESGESALTTGIMSPHVDASEDDDDDLA